MKLAHLLSLALVIIVWAASAAPACAAPVGKIEIIGASTRVEVIQALLDTTEGEEFDRVRWEGDIQRLRNTGFFYDIETDVREEGGYTNITLRLKNKFPLIPIFKYKQGGGASLLTAGVYGVNVLNRLLEFGAQYERFSGKGGAVAWFRHPYFLGHRNRLGTEIYVHSITLPLLTVEGEEEAHFCNDELRWNIFFERQVTDTVKIGLSLRIYDNAFEADNSTPERAGRNEVFSSEHELEDGLTVSLSPSLVVGRINTEGFYVKGVEFGVHGEAADGLIGSDFDFLKGLLQLNTAHRPWKRLNVATQFKVGTKSGSAFQHKFYLGGLDSIRGFVNGQFRGDHMWVANVETRTSLVDRSLWAIQNNLFVDLGKTWDAESFGSEGFESPFISYGIGFRLILPTVYRAVLRIDLARTQEPVQGYGVNFGVQQFF